MGLRTDGGFFVLYSQQVLTVLVGERQRAVVRDLRRVRALGVRRRVAAGVYALAKAVTVLALVLDEDAVCARAKRAR